MTQATEIGAVFVSVVASLKGAMDSMVSGGAEAANAFSGSFGEKAKEGIAGAFRDLPSHASNFKALGMEAASAFSEGLSSLASGGMPDMMKMFDTFEDGVSNMVTTSLKLSVIGAPLAMAWEQARPAFDAFKEAGGQWIDMMVEIGDSYIEASRKIAGATLDTGEVERMGTALRDVMASGAVLHFQDAADVIGRLNQNIQGLDTSQLKELTIRFTEAEELIGQIDETKLAGIFNAFQVGPEEAADKMTEFTNVVRATGAPVNALLDEITQVGPSLRQMGYSLSETEQLFGVMTQQGEAARRATYTFSHALEEFTKLGKDPVQGMKDLITVTKEYISHGKAGREQAEKMLEVYFGQRGAPVVLEQIERGILKISGTGDLINGLNANLGETLEETLGLKGAFERVGEQIQAAFAPVGVVLAKSLVSAGNELSAWLKTHEAEIINWSVKITNWILGVFGYSVKFMADLLKLFEPGLTFMKDAVADAVNWSLNLIKIPLEALSLIPKQFGGQVFSDAITAIDTTQRGMRELRSLDIGAPIQRLDDLANNFANNTIPKVQDRLRSVGSGIADASSITDAFNEKIGTETVEAFEALKDAQGKVMGPDAANNIQLKGTAEQWQDIANKLAKLGINIQTNTAGVVSAITFANEKAHQDWIKWWEEQNKKPPDVKVNIQPTHNGSEINSPADLIPEGDVPVNVTPTVMPAVVPPSGPVSPASPATPGEVPPAATPTPTPTPAVPAGTPQVTGTPPASVAAPTTALASATDVRAYLTQTLTAAGLTPDEIKGILAMNQVEGGETNIKSLLGFNESQAQGPAAHVAAFLKQWFDTNRRPGGVIPGISATGQVTDWNAFLNWIQEKIVGQAGVGDQPPPAEYAARLRTALAAVGAVNVPAAPPAGPSTPVPAAPPGAGTPYLPNIYTPGAPGYTGAQQAPGPALPAAAPVGGPAAAPAPAAAPPPAAEPVPAAVPPAPVAAPAFPAPQAGKPHGQQLPVKKREEASAGEYYRTGHGIGAQYFVKLSDGTAQRVDEDGKPILDTNGKPVIEGTPTGTVAAPIGGTPSTEVAAVPTHPALVPPSRDQPQLVAGGAEVPEGTIMIPEDKFDKTKPPPGVAIANGETGNWKLSTQKVNGKKYWYAVDKQGHPIGTEGVRLDQPGPFTPGQQIPGAPAGVKATASGNIPSAADLQKKYGTTTWAQAAAANADLLRGAPSPDTVAPAKPGVLPAGTGLTPSIADQASASLAAVPVSDTVARQRAARAADAERSKHGGVGVSAKDTIMAAAHAIGAGLTTAWNWLTKVEGGPIGFRGGGLANMLYLQGGGPSDDDKDPAGGDPRMAALLHYAMSHSGEPYQWGTLDCSGLVAQSVETYLGHSGPIMTGGTSGHPMDTTTEDQWLSAMGFSSGSGPSGTFRVGWNPSPGEAGHTAMTLPNDVNFESGGTNGIQYGGPALGSSAGLFSKHAYHLQQGGPNVAGSWYAGRDTVPAMLEVGEYVVNRHKAAKHRHLLDGINYGIHGMQAGGSVGADVNAAMSLVGTPYNQLPNRTDCSGMTARVIDAALGLPMADLMNTENAPEWLAARGFSTGAGGAGDMTVYWYTKAEGGGEGHMVMMLSNGQIAQAGGNNPDGYAVGASVDLGQFHHMAHRRAAPGGEGPAAGNPSPSPVGSPSSPGGGPGANYAGSPGTPGAIGAAGPLGPGYNPWTNKPPWAMTEEQQRSYEAAYMRYQEKIKTSGESVTNATQSHADAATKLAEAVTEQADKQKAFDAVDARWRAADQKTKDTDTTLKADETKAINELNAANTKLTQAREAEARTSQAAAHAADEQQIGATEGPPKPPGEKKGEKTDKDAESLGHGLVKGIFQELGFPDVFGKDPTQWGIWKLAMGGLGYGLNLANAVGDAGGHPQGAAAVGQGAANEAGLPFPNVAALVNLARPNQQSPAPAQSDTGPGATVSEPPANMPVGTGPSPGPGNSVDQSVTYNQTVNNPAQAVLPASDTTHMAGGAGAPQG